MTQFRPFCAASVTGVDRHPLRRIELLMSEMACPLPAKHSRPELVQAAMAAVICGGLFAVSGCTRTSDGSVEFKAPSLAPGFLRRGAAESRQAAPIAVAPFPQEPAKPAERVTAKPRQTKPARQEPRTVRPPTPQPVEQSEKALACSEQTQPGGRVKVVCE
jgi:hypothetical protein